LQQATSKIHVADALLDYVQALLETSRSSPSVMTGLSPRAGLALLHCAKAWALMAGRNHAVPEDVQAVLPHVVGHRLQAVAESEVAENTLLDMLKSVAIP
jgi:MoxR-like ATPase